LSKLNRNLCVVGDDDQSIYGWRGANIRNILDFEHEFPDCKTIKLEQNYRSTSVILDAANSVIQNNLERKTKNLWTTKQGGENITTYKGYSETDEAHFIANEIKKLYADKTRSYNDFAILYRLNAQSRVIEESFMREGIPYRIFGGLKFYDRKEIKDLLAYLRLIQNQSDDISLKRIINVPKRGIGNTSVDLISDIALRMETSIYNIIFLLPW
jgi:DNA helicase-2/ATP-dependent DNA helicase PcrA